MKNSNVDDTDAAKLLYSNIPVQHISNTLATHYQHISNTLPAHQQHISILTPLSSFMHPCMSVFVRERESEEQLACVANVLLMCC
jgi:hypothetical protein